MYSDQTKSALKTPQPNGEAGFSLIEVAVAMVIMMIALLGVVLSFSYAITYNAGNYSRARSLAVLKRESERIRSAKFTPSATDVELQGGVHANSTATLPDGTSFIISRTVDNDPYTEGVQDESVTTSYKEITITARLNRGTAGWQSAIPTTVVLRRVKSN